MKIRLLLSLIFAMTCIAAVYAGHDVHISYEQLPLKAKQFIQQNYSGKKIAIAKMETELMSKSYDVIFTDGDKLEFDGNGNWTEIKSRNMSIPAAIIPSQIKEYVKANYPGSSIIEIKRKWRYHEIELSNKLEIKFDKNFKVIEIDY